MSSLCGDFTQANKPKQGRTGRSNIGKGEMERRDYTEKEDAETSPGFSVRKERVPTAFPDVLAPLALSLQ